MGVKYTTLILVYFCLARVHLHNYMFCIACNVYSS